MAHSVHIFLSLCTYIPVTTVTLYIYSCHIAIQVLIVMVTITMQISNALNAALQRCFEHVKELNCS